MDGEQGMKAVVVGDVASNCFLTSIDSLYTEGKVAMDMLDYNQTIGRSFFLDFVVQC